MLELLEVDKSKLSKKDYMILDYLLRNENQLFYENSKDIAKKIGVSNTTISRFWKKIGYQNIKEFQRAVAERIDTTPALKIKNTLHKLQNNDSDLNELFLKSIKNIEKTITLFSYEQLDKAADLILKHKRIYLFAPDASIGIAHIMQYRLRRFGVEFIFINGGSSIYEYLINIKEDDLVIIFCFSRILAETSILLEQKKAAHYDVILFTDLLSQNLQEKSDAIIYSYRGEPTEYHSMVAPMAIVDCMIIKIAMKAENTVGHMDKLNQIRGKYQEYIKR